MGNGGNAARLLPADFRSHLHLRLYLLLPIERKAVRSQIFVFVGNRSGCGRGGAAVFLALGLTAARRQQQRQRPEK
uniref:Uncharacterized protein n=1 Tax=Conchiformibius kuhniae TaxID=211502 RepID=A0A8T9N055_9NEIS|nr:hypothetical protein LVJ77_04185 [Conchiformibius kuhniae]